MRAEHGPFGLLGAAVAAHHRLAMALTAPAEHLIVMRTLLMSFGVVVACRGDGKQHGQQPPRSASIMNG